MPASHILLAPGASGDPKQLARHRSGLADRGFQVEHVALPRGAAERAMPVYREALGDRAPETVIGGQSFGGRVATLIAPDVAPAAVVCFCYPLHAPGRQDSWEDRTSHWPRITAPVLLLSGESDPFARIDLLRTAVGDLAHAELVTYPRLGHTLRPVLDDALDRAAAFLLGVAPG
jgi:predicted alpha/beta-hydrolase family hydrolase